MKASTPENAAVVVDKYNAVYWIVFLVGNVQQRVVYGEM
jgi:hypothetical protein